MNTLIVATDPSLEAFGGSVEDGALVLPDSPDLTAMPPPQDPEVALFCETVDRVFDRDRIETFWDCIPALRALVDSGFALRAIKRELRGIAEDPGYSGEWRPKQLMVARGRGFALSIAHFDAPRRFVHTTPYYGLYVPVGGAALVYDRYRITTPYRNEVFDPAVKIERVGRDETPPGEIFELRSSEYLYDFKNEEPVLLAKLTSAPYETLEWLFSKETLHAWQANDAELSSTQLRVAAYMLGKLGYASSLEPLKKLTQHAHHAVRWQAVKSLGRIDRNAALEALRAAQNDRHPHNRRAAEKTLAQLAGPRADKT
jgi:hypothetical protein